MESTISWGSLSSRADILPAARMALFSRMKLPLSLSVREKQISSMEAVSSSSVT